MLLRLISMGTRRILWLSLWLLLVLGALAESARLPLPRGTRAEEIWRVVADGTAIEIKP